MLFLSKKNSPILNSAPADVDEFLKLSSSQVDALRSIDSATRAVWNLNNAAAIAEEKLLLRDALDAKPKVAYRVTDYFDEEGTLLKKSRSSVKTQNGDGWVISYSDKIIDLVINVTQPTILRIFFFIAHRQTFTGGFRATRKFISDTLGIDSKSTYVALKWLIDKYIIDETRIDGQLEFLVNPVYVTIGSDKKSRLKMWNDRTAANNRKKFAQYVVK